MLFRSEGSWSPELSIAVAESRKLAAEKAAAEAKAAADKAAADAAAKAAADKAAADKAAADKAAADKAAADAAAKAAADKAAADAEAFACARNGSTLLALNQSLLAAIKQYPKSASALLDIQVRLVNALAARCVSDQTLKDFQLEVTQVISTAKTISMKPVAILCVKGKLTKTVTGVNPKCPTGYTKK